MEKERSVSEGQAVLPRWESCSSMSSSDMQQRAGVLQTCGTQQQQNQQNQQAAGRSASVGGKVKIKRELYKTEMCRSWQETGNCRYGKKCQFAHGVDELRQVMRHPKYKTKLCRNFCVYGTCPYGVRCRFIHSTEQHVPSVDEFAGLDTKHLMLMSGLGGDTPASSRLPIFQDLDDEQQQQHQHHHHPKQQENKQQLEQKQHELLSGDDESDSELDARLSQTCADLSVLLIDRTFKSAQVW